MQKYKLIFVEEDNFYRVENPNEGAVLSYNPDSGMKLLEVEDGDCVYAFKDLNGNGVLEPFEDWRLSADERATDLSNRLTIEQIAPLLAFSGMGRAEGDVLSEDVMKLLDSGMRFGGSSGRSPTVMAKANNMVQAYIEKNDSFSIPFNSASDPFNTNMAGREVSFSKSDMSGWPGNLGFAATFSPLYALIHGQVSAIEYRALGFHTALSPQIDLGTEPRWRRYSGTFGESSKLTGDMAAAYIHGFQSTWSGIGPDAEDLGWGKDSVVTMIKHFPGDGTAEAGREGHNNSGKYAVYPGYNLPEHYGVFETALHIKGSKTGGAQAVMASYSIAMSPTGPIGEPVASGYSRYKLTTLLREELGFEGLIASDANVAFNMVWGVEGDAVPMRFFRAYRAGLNQMLVGDSRHVMDAYHMGRYALNPYEPGMLPTFLFSGKMPRTTGDLSTEPGEVQMEKMYRHSAKVALRNSFLTGLFDNPYLSTAKTVSVVENQEFKRLGFEAQKASVVMLKNKDVVRPFDGKKRTVYIPMRYRAALKMVIFDFPAQIYMPFEKCDKLDEYYNVVTDSVRDGADPNNLLQSDIIRRDDFTGVDLAIVAIESPMLSEGYLPDRYKPGIDNGYYPISLQYRKYYADPAVVRPIPIGLDPDEEITWVRDGGKHGMSRYYGGKTAEIVNEYDLDTVLNTKKALGDVPVLTYINAGSPMCFHEFEKQSDAIILGFSISDDAALEVIAGNHEPTGLLPMQMPNNMETVERQLEDVPFDMEVYIDSENHAYDFTFGMNWSGVIADERVKQYTVRSSCNR
jgi:beta-glucosidase